MKRFTVYAAAVLIMAGTALAKECEKKGKGHGKHRKEMLEKFDADGDKKLSKEERAAAKEAWIAKHPKLHEKLLEKFDKDGDGELSWRERRAMRKAHEEKMAEKFDKDGDGELSREEKAELKKAVRRHRARRQGKKDD
ncbi:MAG: hypothetical protein HQ559_17760 [Lentisphaerae bacterium]|nr:hypothetical protein [Lentisphaerota bacterium]